MGARARAGEAPTARSRISTIAQGVDQERQRREQGAARRRLPGIAAGPGLAAPGGVDQGEAWTMDSAEAVNGCHEAVGRERDPHANDHGHQAGKGEHRQNRTEECPQPVPPRRLFAADGRAATLRHAHRGHANHNNTAAEMRQNTREVR